MDYNIARSGIGKTDIKDIVEALEEAAPGRPPQGQGVRLPTPEIGIDSVRTMADVHAVMRALATLESQRAEPAPATVKTYTKRIRALMRSAGRGKNGLRWEALVRCLEEHRPASRSSWQGARAAALWLLDSGWSTARSRLDDLQRRYREAVAACDPAAKDLGLALQRSAQETLDLLRVRDTVHRMPTPVIPHVRSHPKRKKTMLAALPDDWMARLYAEVPVGAEIYRRAVAVGLAAGVRPSELLRKHGGAHLALSPSGAVLSITVESRKCQERRRAAPIEERERTVLLDAASALPWIADLVALCRALDGTAVVAVGDDSRLRKVWREAGKQAFPKMRRNVSPYVARHQVAAVAKVGISGGNEDGRGEWTQDDVSRLLGHSDEKARSRYGTRSAGRRATAVIGVEGPEVRGKPRKRPLRLRPKRA